MTAAAADICLAILAAGASRRFGDTDKLTANLHGKMLGLHAAENFAPLAFGRAVVIAACADHPCAGAWRAAGYAVIVNRLAAHGMGGSVAAAARAASGCSALLIALADMPVVPASHMANIVREFRRNMDDGGAENGGVIVASRAGALRSPPALFGRAHFEFLSAMRGDRGAHRLLAGGRMVDIDADKLIDIDRPETLAALNQ